MRNHQRRDNFVTNLLSGKFENRKDSEGKISKVFVPYKANKYPTLKNLEVMTEKPMQELLEREGLIYPLLVIDREEFKKSVKQKNKLKMAKATHNAQLIYAGFSPKTRLNVSAPMRLK